MDLPLSLRNDYDDARKVDARYAQVDRNSSTRATDMKSSQKPRKPYRILLRFSSPLFLPILLVAHTTAQVRGGTGRDQT